MNPMTIDELYLILNKIDKEHNPVYCDNNAKTRKRIKYARPQIDFRSMTCFSIHFSGFGWERDFSCVNQFDVDVSLYELINAWLDDEPVDYRLGEDRRQEDKEVEVERRHEERRKKHYE